MDLENKTDTNLLADDNLTDDPLSRQEGGDHYKTMAIQPVEYCHANQLGICESNVIKYVSRYKKKNGKQDLEKAMHFLQLLNHLEYGVE